MVISYRSDLSSNLVHFIRAESDQVAFNILRDILDERQLRCGTGYIRGNFCCICFCEAPRKIMADFFLQSPNITGIPYRPFGILFPKKFIFSLGGRPVIYQRENEYETIPEEIRWRHVRYEPDVNPPIDFTWEREWRMQIDAIPLDPDIIEVIVPSEFYKTELIRNYEELQDYRVLQLSQVLNEDIAKQYRGSFPWIVKM